jgi:hypothetical protein
MADAASVADTPGWLVSLLATYLIVWSVLGIAFIAAVVFGAIKVKRLISRASTQVKAAAEPVTSAARDISGRVERIGKVVETTVTGVARKMDAASDSFATPLAGAAAFVSGVRKGIAAARAKRSRTPDDQADSGG